jgi:hypothetical protein
MIKLISALILTVATFSAQAAPSYIEFETKEQCNEVWTGFHTKTQELGLTRIDHMGRQYFVKEGWVGQWEFGHGCNQIGNGKLTMEPIEEFNERMAGQFKINVKQPDEFWDSTAGTVTKVVIGVAIAAVLWKISAPMTKGCANTWNIAKDGSICGGRAASVRPGGK